MNAHKTSVTMQMELGSTRALACSDRCPRRSKENVVPSLNSRLCQRLAVVGEAQTTAREGRSLTLSPTMVGQTCRFAPISPPASAAMLAKPWGYARQNTASLVLVKVWAARQHRPTLMVMSRACCPNYFPLRMWGRHSCLPVLGTFQSPDSASNCRLWSVKLENFATGRLESPPYNLGNTPSSCARTRGRLLADQQVGPTISANNHE